MYDFVFVGLGNPGPRYALTRHNVGFILLDILAQSEGSSFSAKSALAKKANAEVAELSLDGKKLLLVKPLTFMNLSGQTVGALQQFGALKDAGQQLMVLHDEVDLPPFRVRVKTGGGDAGHNGLKSIREQLGHGDYTRLRFGVGRSSNPAIETADHVLGNFSKDEQKKLLDAAPLVTDTLRAWMSKGLSAAQQVSAKIGEGA